MRFMIDTIVALESDPEYTYDTDAVTKNTIPQTLGGGIAVTNAPSLKEFLNNLE